MSYSDVKTQPGVLPSQREDLPSKLEEPERGHALDLLIRLLIGGVVVSLFAILGDVIKPKSLAGITAAAPAVALATAVLTLHQKGVGYTALEFRSMLAGSVAYLVFAVVVSYTQMRGKRKALLTAAALLPVWGIVAAVFWAVWLRH